MLVKNAHIKRRHEAMTTATGPQIGKVANVSSFFHKGTSLPNSCSIMEGLRMYDMLNSPIFYGQLAASAGFRIDRLTFSIVTHNYHLMYITPSFNQSIKFCM